MYKGGTLPPHHVIVEAWLNDGSKLPHRLYSAEGKWYTLSGYPIRADEVVLKWRKDLSDVYKL